MPKNIIISSHNMTDAVIIIGSISDRDVARKASGMFDKFGIKHTFQSGIAYNKAGDQGSCDCTSVGAIPCSR